MFPDMRVQGWLILRSQSGRNFRTLDASGTRFSGLVQSAPPVDPSLDLGSDLREVSIIECLSSEMPTTIKPGDQIQDIGSVPNVADAGGWKWNLLKRVNNNADFTTQYYVTQVVPGVDI